MPLFHRNSRATPRRSRVANPLFLRLSDYYDPFPRQEQFHRSPAKYRLFGGAAGPGKTKALLWEAILKAHEAPGCDTLLLRRTFPELESSLLAYFRRDVPRSLYRSFHESKRLVTWHNGSTTRFGFCRFDNDVYQYQGAEFLFIGLDELTHFTFAQWQFLTSRNRCSVPGTFPCMAGATNPGNTGHAWVKALWIDKVPPAGMENAAAYDPREYDFIAAHLSDNPIYAHDASYRRTLEALPDHLRRAFLEGDWEVFAGQFFDNFDRGRHVIRPDELRLESWWPRWISIDWGFQHPSAVYWHCAVPAEERNSKFETRNSPNPNFEFQDSNFGAAPRQYPFIFTYREFVQQQLTPRMLAQAIVEHSGREPIAEIFLSPDAYAARTSETSIADQMGEIFAANGLPHPARAENERINGWQLMYSLLQDGRWLIAENCQALIACLPTLICDETNAEDIRKRPGDDPADSARYGLVSGMRLAGLLPGQFGSANYETRKSKSETNRAPGGRVSNFEFRASRFAPPLGDQIARQVTATDPTSRAIWFQQLQADARRRSGNAARPRRR